MGDVGSARYEPALLPPCPTIRVSCYSNCQRSTQSHQQLKGFNNSESETSLLNPAILLQTSPAVNANPTVRMDSNLELVWPKLVPDSCVIKQSLIKPAFEQAY